MVAIVNAAMRAGTDRGTDVTLALAQSMDHAVKCAVEQVKAPGLHTIATLSRSSTVLNALRTVKVRCFSFYMYQSFVSISMYRGYVIVTMSQVITPISILSRR